ncbi:MAG: T9SS type A sorting domain-containing protein [Bacteroidetes bacterium]|nr:T9SS type A sorting domain-containing protein [Bacteroidota bacterium]
MRKLITSFLFLVFVLNIANSGVKERKAKRVVDQPLVSVYSIPEATKPINIKVNTIDGLTEFTKTDYDYWANGGHIRSLVVNKAGDKVWIQVMERDGINNTAAPANRRAIEYAYITGGVVKKGYPIAKASASTGFGGIDVTQGASVTLAMVVGHTPNWWALESGPGTAAFSAANFTSVMKGSLDPEVSWDLGRGTVWVTSSANANRTNLELLKTVDFGATFTSVDTAMITNKMTKKHYEAGAIHNKVEVGPMVGTTAGKLAIFTTLFGAGTIAPLGTAHTDSADQIGYFSSTDGATWTWTNVGKDGQEIVIGTDTLYHYFENFSQYDYKYDKDGKLNAVINGYLYKKLTDTTGQNHFATLFWKEGVAGFKVVSNVADKYYAGYDTYSFPGNALGFAYPTLSLGYDNSTVFATWSQPSVTGGKVDTAAGGIAKMDLWWNVSLDGGTTWKTAAKLAGTSGGLFASAGAHLTPKGTNELVAHFVFLQDTAAGCSVFGEGTRALVPYKYAKVSFDKTSGALTAIGDENNFVVKNFSLEQNYPNPFNPATTIKFNLPNSSNVSVKIYNMMGQEVATLVNGMKEAGSHSISFDGAKLASGVYLYQINAGSFQDVKKMILMK